MKNKKNKGYSMAELLIVVAILIVLASLSVFGYSSWKKNTMYQYNTENAQTFYSLLQTNLSERSAHNTMDEISSVLMDTSNSHVSTLSSNFLSNTIVLEENEKGLQHYTNPYGSDSDLYTGTSSKGGPIYSIQLSQVDYELYMAHQSDVVSTLVYDLLCEYLVEDDFGCLDGSLCVELDPKEGLIYSVFYSKENTEMNYTDTLINRNKKELRKNKIGYYGVLELSKKNTVVASRIVLNKVELNNADTLNLTFETSLSNAANVQANLFTYEVNVVNAKTKKKEVQILINQDQLESASKYLVRREGDPKISSTKGKTALCTVTKYNDKEELDAATCTTMSFPVWYENQTVHLVLDAIDYKMASLDILSKYKNFKPTSSQIGKESNYYFEQGIDTASITRLGLDVNDFYCLVSASKDGYQDAIEQESEETNLLFGKYENSYSISNARHLFNIRFKEGNYILTKNIDWTSFLKQKENLYFNLKENKETDFISLPSLKSSFTSSKEEYGYSLKNFSFNQETNKKYGMDSKGTALFIDGNGTISHVTMDSCTVKGQDFTALLGSNVQKEVSYVKAVNCEVKGNNIVGGLVAYTTSSMSNCTTSGNVEGNTFVGGIVGLSNSRDKVISNCTNAMTVTGQNYVGGINGANIVSSVSNIKKVSMDEIVSRFDFTNQTIQSSTNNGNVVAYQNYMGGITGYNSGNVLDCMVSMNGISNAGNYSGGLVGYNSGTIQASSKTNIRANVSGKNYVGGLVGYNDIDAVVLNYDMTGNVNASGSFVGGWIGLNASKNAVQNQTLVSNVSNVSGKYAVGGMIGANVISSNEEEIKCFINTNNYRINVNGVSMVGGIIGYNEMISCHNRNALEACTQTIADQVNGHNVISIFENNYSPYINSATSFVVDGNLMSTGDKKGTVTGNTCIGGVIGYNAYYSCMTVQNVKNGAQVSINGNIKGNEVGFIQPLETKYSYSFFGGITSYVNPYSQILNCTNFGNLTSNGYKSTFVGGLCEINDGRIYSNNKLSWLEEAILRTIRLAIRLLFGNGYYGTYCGINRGIIIPNDGDKAAKDYKNKDAVDPSKLDQLNNVTDIKLSLPEKKEDRYEDMKYSISWKSHLSSKEKKSFAAYEIVVEDTSNKVEPHYYYVSNDVEMTTTRKTEKDYTSLGDASIQSCSIDLEDFQGKDVQIYMRTLALSTSREYKSSLESEPVKESILSRLESLDESQLKVSLSSIYEEVEQDGLEISYGQEIEKGDIEVKIQCKDVIYTSKLENNELTLPSTFEVDSKSYSLYDFSKETMTISLRVIQKGEISSKWISKEIVVPEFELDTPDIDVNVVELKLDEEENPTDFYVYSLDLEENLYIDIVQNNSMCRIYFDETIQLLNSETNHKKEEWKTCANPFLHDEHALKGTYYATSLKDSSIWLVVDQDDVYVLTPGSISLHAKIRSDIDGIQDSKLVSVDEEAVDENLILEDALVLASIYDGKDEKFVLCLSSNQNVPIFVRLNKEMVYSLESYEDLQYLIFDGNYNTIEYALIDPSYGTISKWNEITPYTTHQVFPAFEEE